MTNEQTPVVSEAAEILAKPTCTVEESARLLGIGRALAYEAVKRGEIQSIKVGGRVLVPTAVLRRLLQLDDTGSVGA
jgi:excisionase family DNA binding protein